jgi:signal transduction histidine kinase
MIFFAGIGFGLFLYSSNRESKINKSWFVVSIFTALWGLGLFGVTSFDNLVVAMWWQYLLDISATFIPVTYFIFVCNLLNIKCNISKKVIILSGIALAIFSLTPFFKEGLGTKYGFHWINPGQYYIIFPAYFGLITIISLSLLIKGYFKNKNNQIFQAQIRNTLIAGIIGFGGGATNFFPQIINIYPFGNYFVLLYVFFMSYGVLKYKLLSKKIISAQLVSGAIVLVFLFSLLQPNSLADWAVKLVLFILVTLFSILLVRGVYKEIEDKEKIEKLAKDLEIANEQQEGLIHFITHQVKGFLSKSRDIFSVMLEGDYGVLPEAARAAAEEGFRSGTKGVDTVKDILDAANLKKGTLTYKMDSFDLKTMVSGILSEMKKNAEAKGLSFETNIADADYNMTGDAEQIKHVIKNLVDNSVRYTEKGGLSVNMSLAENKISFSVKDTGIGITPEDKAHLFTSGGKGKDSLKVNVDSTGFGLYIARKIVEGHKGRIWAESEGSGRGSTFFVELPKKA